MPFVSYAGNHEDVVLHRLFKGQPTGTYVDVGAGHPVRGSVTKNLYDRGWSGVNVEPLPWHFPELEKHRPRDVNLALAVSDRDGRARLCALPQGADGGSSLSMQAAAIHPPSMLTPIDVDVTTLTAIWDRHVHGRVDLLKIDVENHEAEVIAGADWAVVRPRVVVVEAVFPMSFRPTHATWEPVLLQAGYRCALFDGINRFYAQDGDDEAFAALGFPACELDGYVGWGEAALQAAVLQVVRHLNELSAASRDFSQCLDVVLAESIARLSSP